jgi:putative ABC transport system substrate-binding protein
VDELKMAMPLRSIVLSGLLLVIGYGLACADEDRKVARIGQLYSDPSTAKPYDEAFRDGLRSLGYVEGKNVVLVPRYAKGDPNKFPALLSELIAADVDILLVAITAIPAAMKGTRTIPIVAPAMGGDPVADGIVASIAIPGGNITGGYAGSELQSKRLQFAMEVLPGLKRVGLLFEATNPTYLTWANKTRVRTEGVGLSLRTYGVHDLDEIRGAFARLGFVPGAVDTAAARSAADRPIDGASRSAHGSA